MSLDLASHWRQSISWYTDRYVWAYGVLLMLLIVPQLTKNCLSRANDSGLSLRHSVTDSGEYQNLGESGLPGITPSIFQPDGETQSLPGAT